MNIEDMNNLRVNPPESNGDSQWNPFDPPKEESAVNTEKTQCENCNQLQAMLADALETNKLLIKKLQNNPWDPREDG